MKEIKIKPIQISINIALAIFLFLVTPSSLLFEIDLSISNIFSEKTYKSELTDKFFRIKVEQSGDNPEQIANLKTENIKKALLIAQKFKAKALLIEDFLLAENFQPQNIEAIKKSSENSNVKIILPSYAIGKPLSIIEKATASDLAKAPNILFENPLVVAGHINILRTSSGKAFGAIHQIDYNQWTSISISSQLAELLNIRLNTEASDLLINGEKAPEIKQINIEKIDYKSQDENVFTSRIKDKIILLSFDQKSIKSNRSLNIYSNIENHINLLDKNLNHPQKKIMLGQNYFFLLFGLLFSALFFIVKEPQKAIFLFATLFILLMINGVILPLSGIAYLYPAATLVYLLPLAIAHCCLSYFFWTREHGAIFHFFDKKIQDRKLFSLPDLENLNLPQKTELSLISIEIERLSEDIIEKEHGSVFLIIRQCLDEASNIIKNHGGFIASADCFGITAYFNAPVKEQDFIEKSFECTLKLKEKMIELQKKWQLKGKNIIKIKIMLNSGTSIIGNLGQNIGMNYKASGDIIKRAKSSLKYSAAGTLNVCENSAEKLSTLYNFSLQNRFLLAGSDEYVKIFSYDGLKTDKIKTENAFELRKEPRWLSKIKAHLIIDDFESIPIELFNISLKGMAFFCPDLLSVTKKYKIQFWISEALISELGTGNSDDVRVIFNFEICWHQKANKGFLFGAKFKSIKCGNLNKIPPLFSKLTKNSYSNEFLRSLTKNFANADGEIVFDKELESYINHEHENKNQETNKSIEPKNSTIPQMLKSSQSTILKTSFRESESQSVNPLFARRLLRQELERVNTLGIKSIIMLRVINSIDELKNVRGLDIIENIKTEIRKQIDQNYRRIDKISIIDDQTIFGIFSETDKESFEKLIYRNPRDNSILRVNNNDEEMTIHSKIFALELDSGKFNNADTLLELLFSKSNDAESDLVNWL